MVWFSLAQIPESIKTSESNLLKRNVDINQQLLKGSAATYDIEESKSRFFS